MNIFQKLITNVHFATAIYNNEKCSFCDSYFQAVSMQYACSYIWNLCDICEIITLMYQFLLGYIAYGTGQYHMVLFGVVSNGVKSVLQHWKV